MSVGLLELGNQSSRFLHVHQNVITFIGKTPSSNAIRTNSPLPPHNLIAFYEILIEESGPKAAICLGLSSDEFQSNKHPGFEANSYGYFGEDGKKFFERGRGADYAASFASGDIIGCGYHFGTQEIFFTLNGRYLGPAFQKVPPRSYYPTIGLQNPGDRISVNFGAIPFKFDIESYREEGRKKLTNAVLATSFEFGALTEIVKEYLLFCGFENTYQAFSRNLPTEKTEDHAYLATLPLRKTIRAMVLRGETSIAVQKIQEVIPGIFSNGDRYERILFICSCQHFVELIRRQEIDQAIDFMQSSLSPFSLKKNFTEQSLLENVVALLAYQDPQSSPLAHLLGDHQRAIVADILNHAVLSWQNPSNVAEASRLEQLLQQLVLSQGLTRDDHFLDANEIVEPHIDDISSLLFQNISPRSGAPLQNENFNSMESD